MADREKRPAAPAGGAYWTESQRPLVSLVFVTPLLLLYEGGVLLLGPRAVHNGADVWMRQLLNLIGLGRYWLLPVLVVGILLAWHHVRRDRWRFAPAVLLGMLVESALLAGVLVGLAYLERSLFADWIAAAWGGGTLQISGRLAGLVGRLVGYFGAGIYEEVLFRLLLVPAIAALLKLAGLRPARAVAAAIVLTSLAFSAAHYIGRYGDPLEFSSFVFRFLAGAFFAVLFVYRGFGIAAGTHALYDIFVGLFLR